MFLEQSKKLETLFAWRTEITSADLFLSSTKYIWSNLDSELRLVSSSQGFSLLCETTIYKLTDK